MLFLIGIGVVLGSVIGGYTMHHGNLAVLWQPNEFIIIIGAAIGSVLIGNPGKVCQRGTQKPEIHDERHAVQKNPLY